MENSKFVMINICSFDQIKGFSTVTVTVASEIAIEWLNKWLIAHNPAISISTIAAFTQRAFIRKDRVHQSTWSAKVSIKVCDIRLITTLDEN